MTQGTKQAPTLPAYLGTLKSGFELTTRHWWLIIIPFVLDVFLWLGPRLNYGQLGRDYLDFWLAQLDSAEVAAPVQIDTLYNLLEQSNLLSMLSAPLFGVPILLGGLAQTETPIATQTLYVNSWRQFSGNWLLFGLLSMLLSAAYYTLVAQAVRDERLNLAEFGRNLLPNTGKLIILTIICVIALLIIMLPLIFVAGIAGLVNQSLIFVVLIGGSIVIMWGVILLSFTPHVMFLNYTSPYRAIRGSFRVVQRHLNSILPLLIAVVLIGNVTDSLWLLAYDGSWLVLVSLAGHAFIATALLAATFIFYFDISKDPEPELAPAN